MILNYTTTVDAFKTVTEIEYILMKHGAKSIMKNYKDNNITSLSFLINNGYQDIPVKLPVKIDDCMKVLQKEKKANPRKQIKDTREQAERVAWRILKDWVEALPYIQISANQTVYEKLEQQQFLLEGDKK